jgi:hypothetical protein
VHVVVPQFVRRRSGKTKPSKANGEAFNRAGAEIAHLTKHLLDDLVTIAPPNAREVEAAKPKERSAPRCVVASISVELSSEQFAAVSCRVDDYDAGACRHEFMEFIQ